MPRTSQRSTSLEYTTQTCKHKLRISHSILFCSESTGYISPRRKQPSRRVKSFEQPEAEKEKVMSDQISRIRGTRMSSSNATQRSRSQSEASVIDETGSRFTRTGRVSKALKGQPVHYCELCGKLYSRAEHLRRHQLNHNVPTLECPMPNCTRRFFRDDLLARHVEDHRPSRSPSQQNNLVPQAIMSSSNAFQQRLDVPSNAPLGGGSMARLRTVSEPPITMPSTAPSFYGSFMLHHSPTAPLEYSSTPLGYTWQPHTIDQAMAYSSSTSPTYEPLQLGGLASNPLRSTPYELDSSGIGLANMDVHASSDTFDLSYDDLPSTQIGLSYDSFVTQSQYQGGMYASAMSSLNPVLDQSSHGQPRTVQDMDYFPALLDESEARRYQE